MSLTIAGMGWITPLGSTLGEVWDRLLAGETGPVGRISSPAAQTYPVMLVGADNAPVHPRLRRSSAVSRFAVRAGLAALEEAKLELGPESAARTGLILAVSNGGVVYTKRFYQEIVEAGAHAASPLLFPETVFNAPASHMAAILGITGVSYTLVGDGAVGILALKMAEDLMAGGDLDCCLVIGAEETEWVLCDAYRKWRLLGSTPRIEPFQRPARGMILSEGAGAIVLTRGGIGVELERIASGTSFQKQREAVACVEGVLSELCEPETDLIIVSANGTFIDEAEWTAAGRKAPGAILYPPKVALGESVGASSIWQIICGAQCLLTQSVPPGAWKRREGKSDRSTEMKKTKELHRAVISVCGLNQQVAGVRLVRDAEVGSVL